MTRTEALKLALQYANYIPKDLNNSVFDFADMIEAYPKMANKVITGWSENKQEENAE